MYRLGIAFSIFLLFSLLFVACRKSDAEPGKAEMADKVLAYLDARKKLASQAGSANANIGILEKNLDLAAARTERLDNKLTLSSCR